MRSPNPQGKGLVPLLDAWQRAQPTELRRSTPRQVLSSYITGLLVLSAKFHFLPVPGSPYHLYWRENEWQLSMISPAEWGGRLSMEHLGHCTLNADRTWTLLPDPGATFSPALVAALELFQQSFIDMLDTDQPLTEKLPYYVRTLPYYPRLLASALAKSLEYSIAQLDARDQSGSNWLGTTQLPILAGPQRYRSLQQSDRYRKSTE
jgi:hypothetical protein